MDSQSDHADANRSDHAPPKATRRIPSSELFADGREVQIEHAGETYRLRMTKAGKLILTK